MKDDIYETYKDWDMSNAIRGIDNPMMNKFLQAKAQYETSQPVNHDNQLIANVFDQDVIEMIKQHSTNAKDRQKMNTLLRVLFA